MEPKSAKNPDDRGQRVTSFEDVLARKRDRDEISNKRGVKSTYDAGKYMLSTTLEMRHAPDVSPYSNKKVKDAKLTEKKNVACSNEFLIAVKKKQAEGNFEHLLLQRESFSNKERIVSKAGRRKVSDMSGDQHRG